MPLPRGLSDTVPYNNKSILSAAQHEPKTLSPNAKIFTFSFSQGFNYFNIITYNYL